MIENQEVQNLLKQPEVQLAFLASAVVRFGRQVIDYHSQYRCVVRSDMLISRQAQFGALHSLRMLRRAITNAHVSGLIAAWDDFKDFDHSESIPSFLKRCESLMRDIGSEGDPVFASGLSNLRVSMPRIERVRKRLSTSNCLRRLRAFRDKEIAHRLSMTRNEICDGPANDPIHFDIEVVYSFTIFAIHEISTYFDDTKGGFREYRAQSLNNAIKMWKNVNRRLNVWQE